MRRAFVLSLPATANALWMAAGPVARPAARPTHAEPESLIVQAADLERSREIVRAVGGTATHELGIIGAVAAELSPAQVQALREIRPTPRLYANATVKDAAYDAADYWTSDSSGGDPSTRPATYYPTLVGANRLHAMGVTGSGVTVAVLDSGLWEYSTLRNDSAGRSRIWVRYDAIANRASFSSNGVSDGFGHGTHVTSVIADSGQTPGGTFEGVAPDARLIPLKAFDGRGTGTYANVIRAIGWAVANKGYLGIRVLNCSFSAKPRSHYWDDPLDQAIMRAWQAGIVVVASAGNAGPDAMTVGVPGNVPYVVTVGAMTDSNTPALSTDDKLASFSSAGPTVEGFVKPDLVAPGGHMIGVMSGDTYLAQAYPSPW
jgi:serine protease AprX